MTPQEFELGPRRLIPALPDADPELGEIRWDRWGQALTLTHVDGSCVTCAFPGPMRTARGMTWWTPDPTWVRVRRSAPGRRSQWARAQHQPYWAYSHWAVRCPHCDEMRVFRTRDWAEIAYYPYTVERAVPPADGVLF